MINGRERRFFDRLALLLGSGLREVRRIGPQAVYLLLEDGRELVHKEVPRQERPLWRPGLPWTELVWVDYLSSEGLPVPRLVAADLDHGWLVEAFVDGRLLGSGVDGPAFERLLESLLQVEAASLSAPADVRAFTAQGAEADIEVERGHIARWVKEDALSELDQLIEDAFGGASPPIGPLDIRAENALDTGREVVLIDFATVGADYTERRLAGYMWTALPYPRSFLSEEGYRSVERTLGRKAALRLAFFDFAHCARALEMRQRLSARQRDGRPQWREVEESLGKEWRRSRLDDDRVIALGRGLRLDRGGAPSA